MRTAIVAFPFFTGCVVAAEQSFTIEDDIEGVVIELSNGEVAVEGHHGTETYVELDIGGLTGREVGHEVRDGVLWLSFDCGLACGGDVRVEPPAGVWADVRLDRGDVRVAGIEGEVVATVGAGDLEATDLAGAATCLATGAGSITLETAVRMESIVADVATGDVVVRVPEGDYALDLEAQSGSVETEGVSDESTCEQEISVHVGAGSIEVEGR